MRPLLPLVFLLVQISSNPVVAQQSSPVSKDSASIALIQRTLAAMGATSPPSDVVCTGTLKLAQQNQTIPITIKSKGTQMVRTESAGSQGQVVRVLNQGVGAIRNADGSVRKLNPSNTIAERVGHIPGLSMLSEAFSQQVQVEIQTPVNFNGIQNDVIALSYTPDQSNPQTSIFLNMTRMLFYVERSTGFVSKVEFTRFSETKHIKLQVERQFTDYRRVGALQVPFHQETYVDGKFESSLDLASVQLNVGLQDAEFAIPE